MGAGQVVVLGWTQWFILDTRVQLLRNGAHVGSVARGERAEFAIDGDGELTFRFGDRLRQVPVSAGQVTTIQLRWDRLWGRLRAGIVETDGRVSWQRARRGDRQIDVKLLIGSVLGLAAAVTGAVLIGASGSSDQSSPLLLPLGILIVIAVGGGIGVWSLLRIIRRLVSPSTPPPGWYDDPTGPGQWRYWDGYIWTDHTAPRADGP